MGVGNDFVRFGTSNLVLPPEGPRVLPFILDFSTVGTATQDLQLPIQNGVIKNIQTMFVDNSANANALNIKVGLNGQLIVVPPRSQGYFSILFNEQDSQFTFSTTAAANLKPSVYFANVPIMPAVWKVT